MAHSRRTVRAAAVQAAPVFLDRDATVEKACQLIRTAGQNGAELVALPETYIPAYPYWAWILNAAAGMPFTTRLFENAVTVPGPETAALGAAARAAQACVVVGVNERDGRSLYNTLLFFDRDGSLLGRRRKLKGTFVEKAIWADGDASTHQVYDTAVGRLGGMICAEHTLGVAGYTLAHGGEQIHVAAWVGAASMLGPERGRRFRNMSEACARYHAVAYNVHVINTQNIVDDHTLAVLGHPSPDLLAPGGGWTAIVEAGTGEILAGPLEHEEGILYADLDLAAPTPLFFTRGTSPYFKVLVDSEVKVPVINRPATAPAEPGDRGGSGSGGEPAE